MNDHDDLVRSLMVERFRIWRPEPEPKPTPQQLARAMRREQRAGQATSYRRRRNQPKTTPEGGQTA